ncbi:unnamed protein product [Toxocara canis]|uniref:Carboxypeptidase Q n=2 Tax=Toxocara canis TaxID=6265 RepID=A0A183UJ88_TOXCA|nr:unnamed protein product [Toxocara canis]
MSRLISELKRQFFRIETTPRSEQSHPSILELESEPHSPDRDLQSGIRNHGTAELQPDFSRKGSGGSGGQVIPKNGFLLQVKVEQKSKRAEVLIEKILVVNRGRIALKRVTLQVQFGDDIIEKFRKSSHELLDFVIKGNGSGIACEWLSRLVDEFGHRHLGSENLDKAIDYVVNGLKEDGFDNVHTEEVPDLPKWVRGDDIVEMIDFSLYNRIQDHNVSGKIVVFAQKWMGYSKTAKYRRAAMKVQEIGAVGVLVKSITPYSLALPHTGSGARGSRIPALAITLEEADMLLRMQNRGKKIVIRLDIKSHPDGIVASRNILFEIRGDCLETIRVAFWTAEEQGLLGARYYYKTHKNDTHERFVFVSETDQGAFKPTNWYSSFEFAGSKKQMARLDQIVEILNDYGIPLSILTNDKQGDIQPWADEGIPSVNYLPDRGREYYFRYHHTDADYMSIFKEGDLEYTAAIFGVLAHIVANTEEL